MRTPEHMRLPKIAAVLILPALAACTTTAEPSLETACPPAQIAVPSDQIGHRDVNGRLSFVARMDQLASSCRRENDEIELDIAFNMNVERGPGLKTDSLRLVYFLATVDPNRKIVDKHLLDVTLAFEPEAETTGLREEVTLRLPASTEASGANYSLYLGFQPDRQREQE